VSDFSQELDQIFESGYVTLTEFRKHAQEIIAAVSERNIPLGVTKYNKPVVVIAPLNSGWELITGDGQVISSDNG
jgi:prevent-host-death family protein